MPKITIGKVTIGFKRRGIKASKKVGVPLTGTTKVIEGSTKNKGDITVKTLPGSVDDNKFDLLLAQNKILCKRLAAIENLWFIWLWNFLNKPIKWR